MANLIGRQGISKSAVGVFLFVCLINDAFSVDVAKGAAVAKSTASVNSSLGVNKGSVGAGLVTSIISNGRGSSNIDSSAELGGDPNVSGSDTLEAACAGPTVIVDACLGGGEGVLNPPLTPAPPFVTTTIKK